MVKLFYICTPFSGKTGPFVYGLGRNVFILVTVIRIPYGLQKKNFLKNCNRGYYG